MIKVFDSYLVTEDGDVFSINKDGSPKKKLTKVLTSGGYHCVAAKGRWDMVHRLVAIAYIPNVDNLPVVNHIDNDKINNRRSNLEWCTQKHNVIHSKDQGRLAVGERQGLSKLTEEQVKFIREKHTPYHKDFGTKPLGRKFGVDPAAILHIIRGKTWKHIK